MKFFFVSAKDKGAQPQLKNWFDILNPRVVNSGNYHEVPELLNFDVSTSEEGFSTDVIDSPFLLISNRFSKVAGMYDENLQFKKFLLYDQEKKDSAVYFLPTLEYVNCLSDQCEYQNNGAVISRVVLDRKKIKHMHIFKIADPRLAGRGAVISLELAESAIRRWIFHFKIEEIELA